jgi:hypothetical protein
MKIKYIINCNGKYIKHTSGYWNSFTVNKAEAKMFTRKRDAVNRKSDVIRRVKVYQTSPPHPYHTYNFYSKHFQDNELNDSNVTVEEIQV